MITELTFKPRTDAKIKEDVTKSGMSFIVFNLETIIEDIHRKTFDKANIINQLHKSQNEFMDSDLRTTTTRVNRLLYIIQSNRVLFALEIIASSKNSGYKVIAKAKELIQKIYTGHLILPSFE